MSEFYFDYQCIDMGNQSKEKPKNKALDFYLFQDYENEGNTMCAQIYIPKSMQEKYTVARVYYSFNDVQFPDILQGNLKPIIWYCDSSRAMQVSEANFINTDNSIYIKGENGQLSGCGVIAFMESYDENEIPKLDNCYKFTINYSKKEIISYRIIESKGHINVQVIYPLIRNTIQLCIVQKRGGKPVLVQDRQNQTSKLNSKDEKITFSLKANGRVEDVFKASFPVQDASKWDYRLAFCEPTDSRYYLLVDESDDTLEDKEERRRERRSKNKISLSSPRCPYCGGPLKPYEKYKKGQTLIVGCDGNVISTFTSDSNLVGKLTTVCSADLVSMSNSGGIERSYIEVNNLVIPEGYAQRPSMNLVVAGFPKSGKTIYLSSLFNMQDGGSSRGINAAPFILNKIVSIFDKKSRTVEEVKFLNVDEKNNYSLAETCEKTRSSTLQDIKKRYVMTVGGDVEGQTIKANAEKLSWHPIGFRLGNLGHAFFYDIPGEMFTRENDIKIRALDMADCLLAVINGAIDSDNMDPLGDLFETLERIPRLSKKRIDMATIPIAIVFTKHDLKLTDYVEDTTAEEYCFDENCHVVREDIISLLPRVGGYEGSLLERHIDCSSYELEHYLKTRDADRFNRLRDNYKNIKFFTCSALGSDDCLGKPIDGNKEVLFRPRRLRVELPIIWLMYKKGLIKR